MVSRRNIIFGAAVFGGGMLTGCDISFGGGNGRASDVKIYRMPDEGAPHLRTFMQWPANRDVYTEDSHLEIMQQAIALIARTISRFEPVVMLGAKEHAASIEALTQGKVEHWDVPTDDLWCRDAGPLFVQADDGRQSVMNFKFNGWGNSQPHQNDRLIAGAVAQRLKMPIVDSRLVGEPGGFEFDGESTIIAHESCWVNKDRNRAGRDEITRRMCAAVGAKEVIWAPGVRDKDITDFHIDSLARFVKPGMILIQLPTKTVSQDPFFDAAYETYDILKNATDAEGRKFEIVVVDEPDDIRSKREGFVASYVNYYICNGAVIAAEFGDEKADEAARATLAELYPDREIVMLNVDPIGEAGGGIHCATQQQPRNLI